MWDADDAFSDRLWTLLDERELSQAELARRTGIGRSTLNKIVNGKQRANAKQLGALAHELDVELLELLGLADELDKHEELVRDLDEANERAARSEEARRMEREELEAGHAARIAELEDALAVATAACEAETYARSQAETDAAATIARLEASLTEAAEAHERELTELQAELEAARSNVASLEKERDELRLELDARERFGGRSRKKTETIPEPPWSPTEVVELPDRYAPARAKASWVGVVIRAGGNMLSAVGECFTYHREARRIDEELGY